MKYHAEFNASGKVYEVIDGVVTLDKRNDQSRAAGYYVMPDLQPYQAVASDVESGTAPMIQGRRQHREFISRNGYVEIGNEKPKPKAIRGDFNVREELSRVTHQIYARDNR